MSVSAPTTVTDWVVQAAPGAAVATRNVCARSAGCWAGGVRRSTPALRSSTIVSGPDVRSQLLVKADRSPAPADSQLAKRSSMVALPKRCRVKWSTAPARNTSSPSVALSCLRMLEPLA